MKKLTIIALAVSALLLAALTACQTENGQKSLFTQTDVPVPVLKTNTVTQTNIVVTPQIVTLTNGVTQTNFVTLTNMVQTAQVLTNWQTNVLYTVNSGVTNLLGTGQQLVAESPMPFGWLVSGALGIASAVLGGIAKVKSKQAALVPAIIAGVEEAGTPLVKAAIQKYAIASGVQPDLHATVQSLTANTPVAV